MHDYDWQWYVIWQRREATAVDPTWGPSIYIWTWEGAGSSRVSTCILLQSLQELKTLDNMLIIIYQYSLGILSFGVLYAMKFVLTNATNSGKYTVA